MDSINLIPTPSVPRAGNDWPPVAMTCKHQGNLILASRPQTGCASKKRLQLASAKQRHLSSSSNTDLSSWLMCIQDSDVTRKEEGGSQSVRYVLCRLKMRGQRSRVKGLPLSGLCEPCHCLEDRSIHRFPASGLSIASHICTQKTFLPESFQILYYSVRGVTWSWIESQLDWQILTSIMERSSFDWDALAHSTRYAGAM